MLVAALNLSLYCRCNIQGSKIFNSLVLMCFQQGLLLCATVCVCFLPERRPPVCAAAAAVAAAEEAAGSAVMPAE